MMMSRVVVSETSPVPLVVMPEFSVARLIPASAVRFTSPPAESIAVLMRIASAVRSTSLIWLVLFHVTVSVSSPPSIATLTFRSSEFTVIVSLPARVITWMASMPLCGIVTVSVSLPLEPAIDAASSVRPLLSVIV